MTLWELEPINFVVLSDTGGSVDILTACERVCAVEEQPLSKKQNRSEVAIDSSFPSRRLVPGASFEGAV